MRSDPDQTFLSVAVSQRVFDDVLAGGYAKLPQSRVVQTVVQVKEFTGTVYLYVPNPSGDLLVQGLGPAGGHRAGLDKIGAARERSASDATTNLMTGTHSGMTIQVGHLHGNPQNGRNTDSDQ